MQAPIVLFKRHLFLFIPHVLTLTYPSLYIIHMHAQLGRTPLHVAVLLTKLDVCRYLLERGADHTIMVRSFGNAKIEMHCHSFPPLPGTNEYLATPLLILTRSCFVLFFCDNCFTLLPSIFDCRRNSRPR
jgi:hypothetical protein